MANQMIEAQRGTLLLWLPVGLGTGIGLYFVLRVEPGLTLYITVATFGVVGFLLSHLSGTRLGWLALAFSVIAVGFLDAGLRAHLKAAPVLHGHYYGPVAGRIIAIDRTLSGRLRLTLDQVVLSDMDTSITPRKIRISIYNNSSYKIPSIGGQVILTASLTAPSGPVEPGGFDFQRHAWFRSLGAVGYSRTPVLEIAPPDRQSWPLRLARLRLALAASIRLRIKGQEGAFAAAILTGDRSAVAPESLLILRNSNLAHLLAISGLHMGLLTGFIFALVRYGLALFPFVALRLPVKKLAAVVAFAAAVSYLLLSGANIATQRAFIMVTVALVAVLLDRRALTLRAVAMAAVLVLLLRPESLVEAGFQMSFAATTALVAVFESLQSLPKSTQKRGRFVLVLRWLAALALSSAVAGGATAPISAFHFNRIAEYGLLANLASVPAMGFVVMPAAIIAILVTPLGLSGIFWVIMGAGIGWILAVARWVSALDGAVVAVARPGAVVLPLITGGALVLILLRGRIRLVGLAPALLGFWLWGANKRPDILLSADGRLLGINGESGRWLSKAKGDGFSARNWLSYDGDMAMQAQAALRKKPLEERFLRRRLNGHLIIYSLENNPDINRLCQGASLVIVPLKRDSKNLIRSNSGHLADALTRRRGGGACRILDGPDLRRLGSLSVNVGQEKLTILGARQATGSRLWVH